MMIFTLLFCTALGLQSIMACPKQCFCSDGSMKCTTKLSERDLANLQIPSDVKSVKLIDNGIQRVSAGILYKFRHLEVLEISRNPIKKIPSGTFEGFDNLKRLVLNEDKINEITERSLSGLYNLREIELQRNNISDLHPGVFNQLQRIDSIRIQNNRIKIVRNNVFSTLPKLRDLFLTGNKIELIENAAFQSMQMNRLGLSTNLIKVIPHTAFENFFITERIVLLDNPLDCSCKNAMSYITNMKHLENRIWGYCTTPYKVKEEPMFAAHKDLMCSMCDLNPCKNNGKCKGNKAVFKCTCTEQFKGKRCETNICSAQPSTPTILNPGNVPLKQTNAAVVNHTEYVIVKEQVTNKDDEKKLKILYAMCSFEFVVIICFVVYFMWKRYEEWKLQKQYEHDKSRAILFSIRNQTNAKLAKALCEENEEFPFDIKNMILKGSVPV